MREATVWPTAFCVPVTVPPRQAQTRSRSAKGPRLFPQQMKQPLFQSFIGRAIKETYIIDDIAVSFPKLAGYGEPFDRLSAKN